MRVNDYYSKYYSKKLSVTNVEQTYAFPKDVRAVQVISETGSANDAYIAFSERNYNGTTGFADNSVDTTQADTKTIKLIAGQYVSIALDTDSIKYKTASGTATLQLVMLGN